MRSSWVTTWVLNAMICVLTDRREDRYVQRRRHVKTEAEMGALWSQAKESLEPPGGGRTKEGFTLRAFRRSIALPEPWIWTSGLQNCVRINAFCFQSPSLWSFVMTATGNWYKLLWWNLALHFLLVMLKKGQEVYAHKPLGNSAISAHVWLKPHNDKLYWHHSDGQSFFICPSYFTYYTPNPRWSKI